MPRRPECIEERSDAGHDPAPKTPWASDPFVLPALLQGDGPSARAQEWLRRLSGAVFGALNPQHLLRYDPATDETAIVLRNVGRVRDIAQLPSGKLLIAVDAGSPTASDRGRIIELSPR